MKKSLLFLFAVVFFNNCFGQAPGIEWQKTYGGTNSDIAFCVQQTTDGGYIIGGGVASNDGDVVGLYGMHDYWIIKLDVMGVLQWKTILGGNGDEKARSTQQTGDGGYIIAGSTSMNGNGITGVHGGYDYFIVKLNSLGLLQWQKTLGGSADDNAKCIQLTPDGGFIVAGSTASNDGDVFGSHGLYDCWIVKLSATGNIQWQKTLGGSDAESASSIKNTSDGGFIVSGGTRSSNGDVTFNHGSLDCWVIKLSVTGEIEWQKTYGGSDSDYAFCINQTSDGGYIIAGNTLSTDGDVIGNNYFSNSWILKLNSFGSIEWQKTLANLGCDSANEIQQTANGEFIFLGGKEQDVGDGSGYYGQEDFWVAKFSPVGTMLWNKTLGGSGVELPSSLQQTSDGGYIVVGATDSTDHDVTANHGSSDYWIVKLTQDPLSTASFNQDKISIYPNPATSILNLSDEVLVDKIIITDVTGKTILQQSENTNQVNVENLASGMYLIKASSGEKQWVSKFVKQ